MKTKILIILIVLTFITVAYAANKKWSAMTANTTVADDDVMLLIDTGTGVSQKITVLNLFDTIDTSLELLTILTNETGTGALVFATTPTLVTPILGTITSGVGTALTALNGENIQDDTIDDDSIDWADCTFADFDYETNWKMWHSDGAGDVTEIALGANGTFLESNGAAAAPAFRVLADGDVPDNITIDLATLATTVTVSDDEATNDNHEIVFTTDNTNLESDGNAHYNPSTGTITATQFVGGGLGGNTAYDDIADPDAAGSISFDAAEGGTYTSADDQWVGITISNTQADNAGDTELLTLAFTDDGDTNSHYLIMSDAAGTQQLEVIQSTADVQITTAGDLKFIAGGGDFTFADDNITTTGTIQGTSITATTSLIAPLFDAAGAEDMDYGSVDVTDHTFTTDDCTVVIDGGVTVSTGDVITLGAVQWNSADEIDGTKIKDADYGDIDVSAGGAWTLDTDSVADNEIDYGNVTGADLTLTDAGAITSTGTITATVGFDIVGAADIDYGSIDVLDHTFVTDGTGTAEIVLPAGSIDGTEILDDTIDSADYAAASIDNEHLADDAVDSAEINTNAVKLDALDVTDVSDDIAGDIAEGELANAIIVDADIKDDVIQEPALNVTNAGAAGVDNYVLSYNHAGTNFTWVAAGAGDMLKATYDAGISGGVDQITTVDSTYASDYVLLTGTDVGTAAPKTDGGLTYDATSGTLSATQFVGGGIGGTTAWDDIVDPDAAATVDFVTYTQTIDIGVTDDGGPKSGLILDVTGLGAGITDVIALEITTATNDDTDYIPIAVYDDSGADNDKIFEVDSYGNVTIDDFYIYNALAGNILCFWNGTTSDEMKIGFDGTDVDILWNDGVLNIRNEEDGVDAIVEIEGKDAGEKGILRVLSDGDDKHIELHHDDTDAQIISSSGDIYLTAPGGDINLNDDNLTTTGTATFAGGTLTGNIDIGGGDLELPQASPAVPDADGEVEVDFTDGKVVIQHGAAHAELGGATDVVMGSLIDSWGGTIYEPDGVNDVLTVKAINSIEFPHGVVITAVYLGVSEDSDYTLTIQNFDDFDTINGVNPTIDTVTYSNDTTGEIIDTTPTFATIAAGQIIMISIPATDVAWINFCIYYYEPAA